MTRALVHLERPGLVTFFAALFFFFGCGDPAGKLPDQATGALGPRVEAIRSAAAAGDRTGAQAGVDALRAQVSELRDNGVLGEDAAVRVLDAVEAVEARLALLPAPTTTTTAPPPAPSDDDEDRDRDRDKGKKHDDD
jgi:hypothetical protein